MTGKSRAFPLEEDERKKLQIHRVQRVDRSIPVVVPDEHEPDEPKTTETDTRESIKIQALLARIGAEMGLSIWIPKNDRKGVLSEWKDGEILDRLPLNYDEITLQTIERIDVLWLRRRSIVRAFEVEHTTAIYSGILRMADLLALQPNMDIKLHLVAPEERRDKVLAEIQRPVFSLLDRAPLSEVCSFIGYDSVREIANIPHLQHVSDTLLDEYAEEVE
ncbi:MAG: hypothetical protein JXA30_08950 [Deltaproteobacteria bacterium]|nr:hypothetical protein [Deltaproteobacteria bacterium]